LSNGLVKNAIKVAYFCRLRSRNRLQDIRIAIGEEMFQKALELLEKFNIVEYPMEYPETSRDFPRGMPSPGASYFLVSFIYYPAWIKGYMHHLQDLKKMIKKLKITGELVETVRREISEIDPEYRSLFKEQLNMIASWNTKDKKVLEQLLDETHHGKIKFSKSTTYWMG
jgi:hypothetical protein